MNPLLPRSPYFSWREILSQKARDLAEQDAFVLLNRQVQIAERRSFAAFEQDVLALATQIAQTFKVGDRLLLLYEPGIDFCIALWACLVSGRIAVPVYPPGDPRTRERFFKVAKAAEASGVLTTKKIRDQISLARWLIPRLLRLKWLSTDLSPDLSKSDPVHTDWAEPDLGQVALLQYTSGSTAEPKGVMLSHQSLQANFASLTAARLCGRPEAQERFVSWLPQYHDMGLVSGVLYPLVLGSVSVIMSPLDFLQKPVRWLQAISDFRGSLSCAPNFAYELCLKRITDEQMQGLDLSCWQIALNGAEPVRPETLRRFGERFAAWGFRPESLYPSYGLAESTVFVSGGIPQQVPLIRTFSQAGLLQQRALPAAQADDRRELVSLGRCWGQSRLEIRDPDSGQVLPEGQIGEIYLAGPSLGIGYWREPELTQARFQAAGQQTWLQTGDLGFVFAGDLFISGRQKDLIIVNGQNYSPADLEQTVEQAHPDCRQGCGVAFGVGEPEKLVVVQEIRLTSSDSVAEIKAQIRADFALHWQLPLSVLLLVKAGSLSKTSSGKIQRRRCRALYLKNKFKDLD